MDVARFLEEGIELAGRNAGTQRKNRVRTPGEGHHLEAEESGLGSKPNLLHFGIGLPSSRMLGRKGVLRKLPSLWSLVRTALAN